MTAIDKATMRLQGKLRFAKTEEDRKGALREMQQAARALEWAKKHKKTEAA